MREKLYSGLDVMISLLFVNLFTTTVETLMQLSKICWHLQFPVSLVWLRKRLKTLLMDAQEPLIANSSRKYASKKGSWQVKPERSSQATHQRVKKYPMKLSSLARFSA